MTVGMRNREGIIRNDNRLMEHVPAVLGFDQCLKTDKIPQRLRGTKMQYLDNHGELADFAQQFHGNKEASHHPKIMRATP